MTPNEYQKEASRTDLTQEGYMTVNRRMTRYENLIHAQFGISSEAGEIANALKKHFIYGQPLNVANIKEELGDILWYVALACDSLNFKLEDVMQENVEKLRIRYPEKFTEKDAAERKDKLECLICGGHHALLQCPNT